MTVLYQLAEFVILAQHSDLRKPLGAADGLHSRRH